MEARNTMSLMTQQLQTMEVKFKTWFLLQKQTVHQSLVVQIRLKQHLQQVPLHYSQEQSKQQALILLK